MDNYVTIRSIQTTTFTSDGNIVLAKNKNNELDMIPQYIFGHKEKAGNYDQYTHIGIINNEREYSNEVAHFFAKHDPMTQVGIEENFLTSNPERVIDCGTLAKDFQINEMANASYNTFIRIKNENYETNQTLNGTPVINEVETRYLVISKEIFLDDYKDITIVTIEQLQDLLENNQNILSERLFLTSTKDELEQVTNFSKKLKQYNEATKAK